MLLDDVGLGDAVDVEPDDERRHGLLSRCATFNMADAQLGTSLRV